MTSFDTLKASVLTQLINQENGIHQPDLPRCLGLLFEASLVQGRQTEYSELETRYRSIISGKPIKQTLKQRQLTVSLKTALDMVT